MTRFWWQGGGVNREAHKDAQYAAAHSVRVRCAGAGRFAICSCGWRGVDRTSMAEATIDGEHHRLDVV